MYINISGEIIIELKIDDEIENRIIKLKTVREDSLYNK